jgi:hypothetical protein
MMLRENNVLLKANKLNGKAYTGIFLISVIYFADVSLKASRKCFWFDELFTTYLCRLHDFDSTWKAVLHGADFNPPLLYLFTRWAQWLFGDGLIATRLPSMFGVWLFGVCLFVFVSRRAGVFPGLVAGIFPFFTLAQYYAYEARAHGIVLGWCGLTLVCWQRRRESRARNFWLGAFGLCLAGALLTHVYAVYILFPFGLVELYKLFEHERPDWGVVGALVVSVMSVSLLVYLPLFRIYKASVPVSFFPASHEVLQRFFVVVIGPAISVLLMFLILLAIERTVLGKAGTGSTTIPKSEVLLAASFACIPLVGLLGSRVSHGPFIERYFLSSVAGYAILLGFASYRSRTGSWLAPTLGAWMLLLMFGDLGAAIYFSAVNRVMLTEPSARIVLSTNPANPMERYETVSGDRSGLDILVLREVTYLYFVRYASAAVVPRLYFAVPENDMFLGIYDRLAKGAQIQLKTTLFQPFLATHNKFLVYGNSDAEDTQAIQYLAAAGYRLVSARSDLNGAMYQFEK